MKQVEENVDTARDDQETSPGAAVTLTLRSTLTWASTPSASPRGNAGDIRDEVLHNSDVDIVENYLVGRKGHDKESGGAVIILHCSHGSPLISGCSVDNVGWGGEAARKLGPRPEPSPAPRPGSAGAEAVGRPGSSRGRVRGPTGAESGARAGPTGGPSPRLDRGRDRNLRPTPPPPQHRGPQ